MKNVARYSPMRSRYLGTFFGLSLTFTTSQRWSGLAANRSRASSIRMRISCGIDARSFSARRERTTRYTGSLLPCLDHFIVAQILHYGMERPDPSGLDIRYTLFHRLDLFRCEGFLIVRGFGQAPDNIVVGLPGIEFQIIQERLRVCPHPHGRNFGHILQYTAVYYNKRIFRETHRVAFRGRPLSGVMRNSLHRDPDRDCFTPCLPDDRSIVCIPADHLLRMPERGAGCPVKKVERDMDRGPLAALVLPGIGPVYFCPVSACGNITQLPDRVVR